MSIFTSNQQVLDHVLDHLRKQMRQSVKPNLSCAYRTSDGNKCAIGACIPDELYHPNMDAGAGMTILDLQKQFPEVYKATFSQDVSFDFLNTLQSIHDNNSNPGSWWNRIKEEAELRGLEYKEAA